MTSGGWLLVVCAAWTFPPLVLAGQQSAPSALVGLALGVALRALVWPQLLNGAPPPAALAYGRLLALAHLGVGLPWLARRLAEDLDPLVPVEIREVSWAGVDVAPSVSVPLGAALGLPLLIGLSGGRLGRGLVGPALAGLSLLGAAAILVGPPSASSWLGPVSLSALLGAAVGPGGWEWWWWTNTPRPSTPALLSVTLVAGGAGLLLGAGAADLPALPGVLAVRQAMGPVASVHGDLGRAAAAAVFLLSLTCALITTGAAAALLTPHRGRQALLLALSGLAGAGVAWFEPPRSTDPVVPGLLAVLGLGAALHPHWPQPPAVRWPALTLLLLGLAWLLHRSLW